MKYDTGIPSLVPTELLRDPSPTGKEKKTHGPRLLALADREFWRSAEKRHFQPARRESKGLDLNLSKFDTSWDRKCGAAARLAGCVRIPKLWQRRYAPVIRPRRPTKAPRPVDPRRQGHHVHNTGCCRRDRSRRRLSTEGNYCRPRRGLRTQAPRRTPCSVGLIALMNAMYATGSAFSCNPEPRSIIESACPE